MLTENDVVDAEMSEELATAKESVVDDAATDLPPATMPETDSELETSSTPEPETKPESDELDAMPVIEVAQADKSEPKARPKQKRRGKGRKHRSDPVVPQVISWFAACGRCSYFFTGYRIIAGEETLKNTIAQRSDHWLTMAWSREMVNLVHKSYGNQVDTGCYHFEGCCSECRRHFVFQSAEETDGTATFRIELKTKGGG